MSQLLDYTTKKRQNREKNIENYFWLIIVITPKNDQKSKKQKFEKLFLAQIGLKRLNCQLLDYTKKRQKIEKKI